MIAVAITPAAVAATEVRLGALGAAVERVVPVAPERSVMLATTPAGADGPIAEQLRCEGLAAVARPDGGAALEAWQRDTTPVVIEHRLAVVVAWSEHDRPRVPFTIELGPGGFGNGHHPTTRLLLEVVVGSVAGGERVLDVGCGSGVLGLAAVALGASELIATDRKQAAVDATIANAAINGVEGRVAASADPGAMGRGPFDLVVANIARDGIVSLASELVLAASGGRLAVSGITPSQVDLVVEALDPLVLVEHRGDDGWAALVFSGRG